MFTQYCGGVCKDNPFLYGWLEHCFTWGFVFQSIGVIKRRRHRHKSIIDHLIDDGSKNVSFKSYTASSWKQHSTLDIRGKGPSNSQNIGILYRNEVLREECYKDVADMQLSARDLCRMHVHQETVGRVIRTTDVVCRPLKRIANTTALTYLRVIQM